MATSSPRKSKVPNILGDWDDVRFLLAVAKTGSFSAAATQLNTKQTTVGRRIQLSVRSWAGALYVFAVNSSRAAVNAKMSIPALNGRPVTVMGESRRVNSDGDTFSDRFAPLAVHLYIAAPAGF